MYVCMYVGMYHSYPTCVCLGKHAEQEEEAIERRAVRHTTERPGTTDVLGGGAVRLRDGHRH
jgi:hypothetical protein